jgi:hypothetical protein
MKGKKDEETNFIMKRDKEETERSTKKDKTRVLNPKLLQHKSHLPHIALYLGLTNLFRRAKSFLRS